MRIERIAHIVDEQPDKFYELLNLAVEGMQERGWEVEIQYQIILNGHAALVIGRKVNTQ